jgi:beta-glucosidase-like glycosyl hydrolase
MDWNAVLQVVIVIVALAIGVFGARFLKQKGWLTKDDLDIIMLVNAFLGGSILTNEIAKKVSRIIGEVIRCIETNMSSATLQEKEDAAYRLAVESITALELDQPIDEGALRKVIQIAVSYMEPTSSEEKHDIADIVHDAYVKIYSED